MSWILGFLYLTNNGYVSEEQNEELVQNRLDEFTVLKECNVINY